MCSVPCFCSKLCLVSKREVYIHQNCSLSRFKVSFIILPGGYTSPHISWFPSIETLWEDQWINALYRHHLSHRWWTCGGFLCCQKEVMTQLIAPLRELQLCHRPHWCSSFCLSWNKNDSLHFAVFFVEMGLNQLQRLKTKLINRKPN